MKSKSRWGAAGSAAEDSGAQNTACIYVISDIISPGEQTIEMACRRGKNSADEHGSDGGEQELGHRGTLLD